MKNQKLVDEISAWMEAPDSNAVRANGHAQPVRYQGPAVADEEVIEKCRTAKNAAKFSDLYDRGDVHAHNGGEGSAADLALLSMLAYYTQDAAQLECLFSASALGGRKKWRRRSDYREATIRKAVADRGEVYQWPRERIRPVGENLASLSYSDGDASYASGGPT